MWDTYHSNSHTERAVPYAKTVNVTENKAVTDDSIKLLKEMQDKAVESLLHSFVLETTGIEIVVNIHRDYLYSNYTIVYKFNINGREFIEHEEIPCWQVELSDIKNICHVTDKVLEGVAFKIAGQLKKDTAVQFLNSN